MATGYRVTQVATPYGERRLSRTPCDLKVALGSHRAITVALLGAVHRSRPDLTRAIPTDAPRNRVAYPCAGTQPMG